MSYALSFYFHRNVSYLFLHLPLVQVHCHTVRQSVLPDLKWYCASNEQPLQRSRCHKGCWWQIHCSCSALLRSTDMMALRCHYVLLLNFYFARWVLPLVITTECQHQTAACRRLIICVLEKPSSLAVPRVNSGSMSVTL